MDFQDFILRHNPKDLDDTILKGKYVGSLLTDRTSEYFFDIRQCLNMSLHEPFDIPYFETYVDFTYDSINGGSTALTPILLSLREIQDDKLKVLYQASLYVGMESNEYNRLISNFHSRYDKIILDRVLTRYRSDLQKCGFAMY